MKNFNLIKNFAGLCLLAVAGMSSCKNDTTGSLPAGTKSRVLKSGVIYNIPQGGIGDHSDASVTGSIAWYFATYGDGNTYNLSTDATTAGYYIANTLVVPAGCTFGETSGVNAAILASSGWVNDDTPYMVELGGSNCTISGIELNGQFRSKQILSVGHAFNHISVINVTAHKSQKVDDAHVILMSGCSYITITGCLLRRASCDNGDLNFARKADLIYLFNNCDQITITNNDLSLAASSGISLAGATNVLIDHNTIANVGLSNIPNYISDCITSYHNGRGTTMLNMWITYNTCYNSYNHGVHVSGYDIHVEHNTIYNCALGGWPASNIRLGDQYSPADCSAYCTIKYNYFPNNCPAGGASAVYILGPWKNGTVSSYGQTGNCLTQTVGTTYCD